jgi:hypothetical protein
MRTFQVAAGITCALVSMWVITSHAECLVEEQVWKVKGDTIERAGELAAQLKPLLDQINVINSKAKDPTHPVGPQLSTKDVGRFSELRQRMTAIELQQMLESDYGRDYEVVGELFALAQKLYIGGKEPTKGDADYKPYGIILLMRYLATADAFKGVTDISVPSRSEFDQCDLVAAVHLVENESITKLNQLPIKEASQTLLELRSKSHTPSGAIDRDQLT